MAALTAVALTQLGGAAHPHRGTVVGFSRGIRAAPNFDLPELQGRGNVQLASLRGKPIVINFWSTSCTICTKETPAIARIATAMRGKVLFIGVDTYDSKGAAEAFVRNYHVPYPVGYDPGGVAASRYAVPGLPATFFLSKTGRNIIAENLGALTARSLKAILRQLYGLGAAT